MEIELSKGYKTIIDDEDYEIVKNNKWSYCCGYARGTVDGIGIQMHRFIMGLENGDKRTVDHINLNKLDNRRSNLRICSIRENLCNRPMRKDNKSGYRGVSWNSEKNKWVVRVNDKVRGYFKDIHTAAKKYNEVATKEHGEFASLNIINDKNCS